MPKFIGIEGGSPNQNDLPEWQANEVVAKLVSGSKAGDVVHIVPSQARMEFFGFYGLPQIHGCVREKPNKTSMILWSTYWLHIPGIADDDSIKTFTPEDIRLIELEKAEKYIPRASGNLFRYGSEAQVETPQGIFVVRVQGYFDGLITGINSEGQPITGGASFFKPYK